MDLQAAIFTSIINQFSKKAHAVSAISELLSLQPNAIYRRIRGESPLLANEMAILSKHFKLSLDTLLSSQSDQVQFTYPALIETPKDFVSYLDNLATQIAVLPTINGHLKYASAEIPIYHYCFFPEIIAFKLYTWGQTTWNFPYLQNRKFAINIMSPSDYRAANNFLQKYLLVPSTELWSLNALDNTLNQIVHCVQSGNMTNPEEGLILCDKLNELVSHLQKMAVTGKKFPVKAKFTEQRTDFTLLQNETIYTGNCIIVLSNLGKTVYTTFNNPNYIKTNNEKTTLEMESWFDRIANQSKLISVHAEKDRQLYFNTLVRKIERTRLSINRFLEEDFIF